MSAALAEDGQRVKVRHSRHSRLRLGEARRALAVVHTIAGDFAAQVAELAATTVTDRQWAAFLDAHLPTGTTTRAKTLPDRKRETLGPGVVLQRRRDGTFGPAGEGRPTLRPGPRYGRGWR